MSEPSKSAVERREQIARALFDVWVRHNRGTWSRAEREDAWAHECTRYVGIWEQADAVVALDAGTPPQQCYRPAEVEAALVEWQKRCVANHGEPGLLADEWADLLATITVLVGAAGRSCVPAPPAEVAAGPQARWQREVAAALQAWWQRHPEMPRPLLGEWNDLFATVTALVEQQVHMAVRQERAARP